MDAVALAPTVCQQDNMHGIDLAIKENIQPLRKRKREDKKVLEEVASRSFAHGRQEVSNALAGRQLLQNMGGWVSWPHSCAAVASAEHATQVCGSGNCCEDASGKVGLAQLNQAWHRRHIGQKAAAPGRMKGFVFSECFQQGVCLCRNPCRPLWEAAKDVIKHQTSDKLNQASLVNGDVLFLWVGKPEAHLDINDTDSFTMCSLRATYIPLHYGKPWRPTFLEMQPPGNLLHSLHAAQREPQAGWRENTTMLRPFVHSAGSIMARPCSERLVPLHPKVPGVRPQPADANPFGNEDEPEPEEGQLVEGHVELGLLANAGEDKDPEQSGGEDRHDKEENWVYVHNQTGPCIGFGFGLGAIFEKLRVEEAVAASEAVVAEEDRGDHDADADFYFGQVPEQAEASNDSDSGDSSTTENSSSSTSDTLPSEGQAAAAAPAIAPAVAACASEEGAIDHVAKRARQQRPESFPWGDGFFFTRRERPVGWQVLCRYHAKEGNAACTKTWTCKKDLTAAEHEQALRALKSWALTASAFADKASHQGGRGRLVEAEQHRDLSSEQLDALMVAMPPPP
eukprot:6492280-Amphidinium_carterae.7